MALGPDDIFYVRSLARCNRDGEVMAAAVIRRENRQGIGHGAVAIDFTKKGARYPVIQVRVRSIGVSESRNSMMFWNDSTERDYPVIDTSAPALFQCSSGEQLSLVAILSLLPALDLSAKDVALLNRNLGLTYKVIEPVIKAAGVDDAAKALVKLGEAVPTPPKKEEPRPEGWGSW